MTDINEDIRGMQVRVLEDLKRRRDLLDKNIAELEHGMDNPHPPIIIDFEAVTSEAQADVEFLNQCEKIREGAWVSS